MNKYFAFKESLLNKSMIYVYANEYDAIDQCKYIYNKLHECLIVGNNKLIYILNSNCEIEEHALNIDTLCTFISIFISESYKNIFSDYEIILFKKNFINKDVNICSNTHIMQFVHQYILLYSVDFNAYSSQNIYEYLHKHFEIEEAATEDDVDVEEEEIEEDDEVEYKFEKNIGSLKNLISCAIDKHKKGFDLMACEEY